MEYSIDSLGRGAKSAEQGRIREMVGFRGRGCAMLYKSSLYSTNVKFECKRSRLLNKRCRRPGQIMVKV
jgi:hypothetical protein